MKSAQEPSTLKRKRDDSSEPMKSLTEHECALYEIIRSKRDMGIWTRDVKRETSIPGLLVDKSLKSLQAKKLIKEVVNIQNKGKKHFMAAEFEPSVQITGGAWYVEGNLDKDFINIVKGLCLRKIKEVTVATIENIREMIQKSGALQVDFTKQQIGDIVKSLVLDDEIMEVRSTGTGDFRSIPSGTVCYKCVGKGGGKGLKMGGMASIPCGVCPHLSMCTPDGVINPVTCVYFTKWLEF